MVAILGLYAFHLVPMLTQKGPDMQAKYLKLRGDYNIDWQNWDSGVTQLNGNISTLQAPTGL